MSPAASRLLCALGLAFVGAPQNREREVGLSPVLLEQFMEWKSPLHLNQLPLLSWAQVFSVYSTDLNVVCGA